MASTTTTRIRLLTAVLGLLLLLVGQAGPVGAQITAGETAGPIQPGDTWAALAWRFDTSIEDLQTLNPHPNLMRQPVIGRSIILPAGAVSRRGRFLRPGMGGLLETAVRYDQNLWALTIANRLDRPSAPTLWRPIIVPSDEIPRDLPSGFETLALSHPQARAGEALGVRGQLADTAVDIGAAVLTLGTAEGRIHPTADGRGAVGLIGTGAFFRPGAPPLTIALPDRPLWSQPWAFERKEWTYNQLTLTGEAAEIDNEAIAEERERLFALWSDSTPGPVWKRPFAEPVNNFLSYSSFYGARRSYNGGPYRSYHEGLDYAAYGGTPVYAPAAGRVVLAEELYVRGGAVILDHGWGVYSGYYHMSAVLTAVDEVVVPGTLIGEVGTTGLSTGNHLHWDLLVNGVWVDPAAWREREMGCWILSGARLPGCE